jgi:hypothetical protein
MNEFNNYDVKRVEKCVSELRLHFDTVQIFCTRSDDTGDSTQNIHSGRGNWFARYGQVKAFVHDHEIGYINAIKQKSQEDTEI